MRSTAAVAMVSAEIVSLQVGLTPLQASDQEAKRELSLGEVVSWTIVPSGKVAVQVVPQSMPAGIEVMVAEPGPVVRASRVWRRSSKVAVTARAVVSVRRQGAVPGHSA